MEAKKKLNIIHKNIDELIEYDNNPRVNDGAVDAVASSISEFGFKVPVIITKDNVIVAGHTRVKTCKKLGLNEVPCIVAEDLTDEQIRAFRLADNKTGELASWDLDKLAEELQFVDIDMEQFGFSELEAQLKREVLEDDFDEDEPLPEVAFARRGDVFILGRHRLMCGDSTVESDVKRLTNNNLMDMAFTDPPYNVDYEGVAGKIQNDKQADSDFYQFLFSAFSNTFESLKKGGSIYCSHADTEGLNFRSAFKNAGFKLASCLIWVKNSLVLGRQDYHWRHEPILYGWKEGAAHYFIEDRTQDTIWEYNKPKSNDLHPTMKPLELVGKAITNSSKRGENVIDLFGGSGSTLIACEQIERNAYLMELDERYIDVIVKRYLRFIQSYDNCYLERDGKQIKLAEIKEYNLEFDNLIEK